MMIKQKKESPQAPGAMEATNKSVAVIRQDHQLQRKGTHLTSHELFISVLFVLRHNRYDPTKQAIIYCRITLKGKRAGDFSTGTKVFPHQWIARRQVVKDRPELTLRLAAIKSDIEQLHTQYLVMKKPITAKIIKQAFLGKNASKKEYTLLELMDKEIEETKKLVGNGLKEKTWRCYHTRRNLTADFLWQSYQLKDIALSEITPAFAKDGLLYLKGARKFSHNYAIKTIQAIKRVLHDAYEREYISRNPLASFKVIREKPKAIIHLEEHELERLQHYPFGNPHLASVRDVFVFCCFTGLAYGDVAALHPSHFKTDKEGIQWIIIDRGKTGTISYIPLLSQALDLLHRYEMDTDCIAQGKLLPVLTNQKMNKYLKEIAFILGLKQHLTTHVARKTMGMRLLNNGMAIETVSTILGHSDIAITQSTYAQVKQRTVAKDFKQFVARQAIAGGEPLKIAIDGRG